ncbi:Imm42 family immunity protein [Sinorhizobium garamanticum]|uniref:Imm42 family immunity protein n=1 Tax=Sinorhizobium garamanticum TaxID=680247 RepID=A0ABY8D907_9HYPH|nr:Imm42 family immunity protein [Sinorhizobium garamanticum]WEX86797.1 Imm42 family immunity protein [Sinorhizobium garamanticum]
MQAYPHPSQMALGFFIIHVGGNAYGVRESDASMLGCSFQEVGDRLVRKGKHRMALGPEHDGRSIAAAYLAAFYREEPEHNDFLGLSLTAFSEALISNAIIWVPDGDEAFDDGSHVLQFDIGDKVRIIAFKNTEDPADMPDTLVEQWLDADDFYDVLERWKWLFKRQWERALA